MSTYAYDGKCHNAQPGTYGHECRKPATWIGTHPSGWQSGYCDACKANGYETRECVKWTPVAEFNTNVESDHHPEDAGYTIA